MLSNFSTIRRQPASRATGSFITSADDVPLGSFALADEPRVHTKLFLRSLPFGLSWPMLVTWLLIVISAAALRLRGIGRPFWLDEAWVANSALAPSLRESFRYDVWLQTTPPLFLVAIRLAHQVLGGFEIGFRVVPFAFGLASVLLGLILGKRLFRAAFGLLLGAITAVSPLLISQSLQLKQYSADLFCSFLLMILIWNYSQNSTSRNFAWLLLATLLCLPLGYATIMFLPPAACIILLNDGGSTTAIRRTVIFTVLSSIVFLTLQFVFIMPNKSPELLAYWYQQGAFPQGRSGLTGFYFAGFRRAFWMFYGRTIIPRVLFFAAICGVASLLYSVRSARSRVLLALTGIPVLTLLVLNALGLYPFYQENLGVFLFPCLGVMSILGAIAIAELASRIGGKKIVLELAPVAVCVAAFLIALRSDLLKPPKFSSEDPASAVRFLQSSVHPGDLVYVHASAEEQIKLYMSLFGVHDLPVVFGDTGWPCCTRHHQFEAGGGKDDYVLADFQKQLGAIRARRLLLVFADRPANWEWIKRDERQIILLHEEQMCQRVDTHKAAEIVIDDLRCNYSQ